MEIAFETGSTETTSKFIDDDNVHLSRQDWMDRRNDRIVRKKKGTQKKMAELLLLLMNITLE